jgi:hypothetical protein
MYEKVYISEAHLAHLILYSPLYDDYRALPVVQGLDSRTKAIATDGNHIYVV